MMASNTSTISNAFQPGDIVTGFVKFFNATKGFGFVSVRVEETDVDVFIHASKGKKVTGTHGEPEFTDEPFDHATYPFKRDSTQVSMTVERDNRGGWRAKSWGVLPEYTWIDLYLDHGWNYLEPFVGGRVELHNSSEYGVGGFTARIDSLTMTCEALTFRARHYPSNWQDSRREPAESQLGRSFERSYPLAGAKHDDRHGFLELVPKEEPGTYSRLTFFRPQH